MQLTQLNLLSPVQQKEELHKCCGSSVWVEKMASYFPFANKESLLQKAEQTGNDLTENDWLEAFSHHPKIGDVESLKKKFAAIAQWASGEQASVKEATPQTVEALAAGNKVYEEKFGYIFIVCATGKSAEEMLEILQSRLSNSKEEEIKIAAAEQAKITRLRLEKLLA